MYAIQAKQIAVIDSQSNIMHSIILCFTERHGTYAGCGEIRFIVHCTTC